MKKYIIFDFDGTLINTNDIIIESWQDTFRRYLGHEFPVRTIEATFGEVLADSIEKLIPDADVGEAIAHYRAFQDSHHDTIRVYVYDGIRETLKELKKRGCLIGIGTSRTAYSLQNYMREHDMEDFVDEIVTMNDVTHHKPHSETAEAVLLKLMAHDKRDQMRPHPASDADGYSIPQSVRDMAIMIGDTKYDVGCAQNAGIDSVLAGWSHYVDEEDMAESGFIPTYRIAAPEELLAII